MAGGNRPTEAECFAAIRGEKVPRDVSNPLALASLIRGIRLHYAFATSGAVTELSMASAAIARARNARLIMSDELPDAMAPDNQPYCIWYPDFASEQTYRVLVQRYPQMRYQVGRACAAAGYHVLYRELDLLPDVSIAEEAREGETAGGRLIYESIMSSPRRYAVMDDCLLSIDINTPRSPAFLNGDTEVRWRLDTRVAFTPVLANHKPCIEEDMHVHTEDQPITSLHLNLSDEEVKLLYEPLPPDLPTMKKTLLTHMAAFDGNIDRYARLATSARTINMTELVCIVRGIYHHTMFARWWASQIADGTPRVKALQDSGWTYLARIRAAISARRIMLNDPQEFREDGWPAGAPQPFMIWWPLRPDHDMLGLLADKVPSMKTQVAVAAIYCDYEGLYKRLQPDPNWYLWTAAANSRNTFYRQDIEKRAEEQGIDLDTGNTQDEDGYCLDFDLEPTRLFTYDGQTQDRLFIRLGPYGDGQRPDTSDAELKIWDDFGILR
ncbi:hypothetical protein PFICI_03248 [Pestalotiopsis fici W106-1]|uniref:Uncharacterized protein n=1 Tax=Pestalotiopsis fici (strain W106-1 / CGMCC3.15140) TaxID=1229662 RepID=W3XGN2_PESFW|nr:uncharacterized protein PFICI_03248 [Pestalotiopsis fici W106-1]ETS85223.1 hypothetical protein PFICI_03248 [Pestalotiopsis fici W106-1]